METFTAEPFDIENTTFRFLGTVERIVWPQNGTVSDSGFGIIAVIPNDEPITNEKAQTMKDEYHIPIRPDMVLETNSWGNISVKGPVGYLVEGQTVYFVGKILNDDRYGQSFTCDYYELMQPDSEEGILKMLETGFVKHIGHSKAKALIDMFGVRTLDILSDENAVTLIQQVSGIGSKIAPEIVESWNQVRVLSDLVKFLASHGISFGYAMRVWNTFKHTALGRIQNDPYSIIQCWGIGFTIADQLGRNMGLAEDDPRRIAAGIQHCLSEAEGEGHCYLELDDLIQRTINLFASLRDTEAQITHKMVTECLYELLPAPDLYGRYIDHNERTPVVMDGTKVYSGSLWLAETEVARHLQRITSRTYVEGQSMDWDQVVSDLNRQYTDEFNRPDFELHDKQINAIQTAVRSGNAVIVGGPGCGKTTIIRSIIKVFTDKLGLNNILLAAPTGRAAKRMSEATDHEASTIHRLLGFSNGGFAFNEHEKLEGALLIIDEASMVDIRLMWYLIRAIPSGMRFVIVGDKDQLPSVGPGNVLRDIMDSGVFPLAELNFVFRQQAGSLIKTNAKMINEGNPNIDKRSIGDDESDFFLFHISDAAKAGDKVVELASKVITEKFGYVAGDIQVLSPQKNGPIGINALNARLQAEINPPSSRKLEITVANNKKDQRVYRMGDRVMIVRNLYDLGLMNGDLGTIVDIDFTEKKIKIGVDGEHYMMSFTQATSDMTLAYAMTIHKCVTGDSLVSIPGVGIKPIRDTKPGEFILTGTNSEPKKIKGHWRTGNKPVWEIRTKLGYTIRASKEHPILIADNDGSRFVKVEDIKTDMYACIDRSVVDGQDDIVLPDMPYGADLNERILINPPKVLDEDIAWLIGALVGDGCVTNTKDGRIDLTTQDESILNQFESICKGYGLKVTIRCRDNNTWQPYFHSKPFRKMLDMIGLGYNRAPDKCIPFIFWRAKPEIKGKFLQGLFDTDGSIGKTAIRLTTSSSDLAKDVQFMLLSLGVISGRGSQNDRHHVVTITGADIPVFERVVGFSLPYKADRLDQKMDRVGKNGYGRIPFGDTIRDQYKTVYKKLHPNTKGRKGMGLHGKKNTAPPTLKSKIAISYYGLNQLADHAESEDITIPLIDQTLRNNHYYDQITSIAEIGTAETMYDIEVDQDHSFVANGFVCHNSQGGEFPCVIMIMHPSHHMMLMRNLLYTGITRASRCLILITTPGATERAVRNNVIEKRNSGLVERLNGTKGDQS
jgi:exodeoxyribonuclease V alpha subunit